MQDKVQLTIIHMTNKLGQFLIIRKSNRYYYVVMLSIVLNVRVVVVTLVKLEET